jgi:hypothetical protein
MIFFVFLFGLGYSICRFLKLNTFEDQIFNLGVGLSVWIVVAVSINALGFPLDWKMFFALAIIAPLYDLIIRKEKFSFSFSVAEWKKTLIPVLVLIVFLVNAWIYVSGAFRYPWLEDADSWSHAASSSYVAVEKNLNAPQKTFQYLNPYPPGYAVIIGILKQTNPSLYVTLKFFNAFIVALSFLFFYVMAEGIFKSRSKAWLAMLFLSCLPSYLTHFIWAHSLSLTLFWVAFAGLLRMRENQRYIYPSMLSIAAIFLVQPTKVIKFTGLVLILFVMALIYDRKFSFKIALSYISGAVMSLIWWHKPLFNYFTGNSFLPARGGSAFANNWIMTGDEVLKGLFKAGGGTATKAYSFQDFFYLKKLNLINSPVGIGPILSCLTVTAVIIIIWHWRNKDPRERLIYATLIGWLMFIFLGINTKTFNLPVGLFAFRFWALFAAVVSLLSVYSFDYLKTIVRSKNLRLLVMSIILISVVLYGGGQKLKSNRSIWHYGIYWNSLDELKGYMWLREKLPSGSKVFAFTDNFFVLGMDMSTEYWRDDYKRSLNNAINLSEAELADRLNDQSYRFIIVGQREMMKFGEEKVKSKIESFKSSRRFKIIKEIPGKVWIFQINSNSTK